MKKLECDTDCLNVDTIKGIVIELRYSERRITKIYYRKPNLPFEDSIVSIESDEVRESIVLNKSFEYVSLYVEHNDEPQRVVSANNGNESNNGDGHNECMADKKYEEYGSEVEDKERGKKRMHDEMVADLDGLKAKNRESWGQRNAFADKYAYYHDSDDADSPVSSESDVNDDDGDKGRK
ncbi:hypothetical protein Cgig2_023144 [Carnegiea gigantea]|uniref:Uncharacterized protein n=1 Tax=Carnegiea gigantea TaxID=171969 RepID=A0A9Q1KEN5_9CARY|nr:hypothetical protein Cgig2_023144 [Carnegiea gigantea]